MISRDGRTPCLVDMKTTTTAARLEREFTASGKTVRDLINSYWSKCFPLLDSSISIAAEPNKVATYAVLEPNTDADAGAADDGSGDVDGFMAQSVRLAVAGAARSVRFAQWDQM